MADYLNIAGRIRTTASDGVAMEAQEVKDLNQNKSQQEINADVQTELGDRYTKEETYTREELNELITTPDVNRVYVIATNLTTAVTDLLPATGSSDTLYNVGNWNGTQYDTTVYSIYGWDGMAYVCLAVRSSIGEVYDISANHPDGQGNPTPYADLAAALGTNGANIQADIRRGGMSIKFIQGTAQSSDNKYVQFRYMGTDVTGTPNPFLDIANWQGVDAEPTPKSKNLIESGVVDNAIDKADIKDRLIQRLVDVKRYNYYITAEYKYTNRIGGGIIVPMLNDRKIHIKLSRSVHIHQLKSIPDNPNDCLGVTADICNGTTYKSGTEIDFTTATDIKYLQINIPENTSDISNFIIAFSVDGYDITRGIFGAIDLCNYNKYFKESKDAARRVVELYLTGLDTTKQYYINTIGKRNSGSAIANFMQIFEKSSNTEVARLNDSTQSFGVTPVNQRNSSGISGYAILNLSATDDYTALSSGLLDINIVSNLDESPSIKQTIGATDKLDALEKIGGIDYINMFDNITWNTGFLYVAFNSDGTYADSHKACRISNSEIAQDYKYASPFFMKKGDILMWDNSSSGLNSNAATAAVAVTDEHGHIYNSILSLPRGQRTNYRFVADRDMWVSCNVFANRCTSEFVKWYRSKSVADAVDNLHERAVWFPSDEYKDLLEQCKKRETLDSMAASEAASIDDPHTGNQQDQLVLIHFSDIHNDYVRFNRLLRFKDKFSSYIDDIVLSGDITGSRYSNYDTAIAELDGYDKVLMCIGNHDVYDHNGDAPSDDYDDPAYWATEQEKYERWMQGKMTAQSENNNIAGWGVVQPVGAGENGYYPCYYYKDYTNQKIRLIVIDAMAKNADATTQLAWFNSVLSETLDENSEAYGYHVMCVDHFATRQSLADTQYIDCGFNCLADMFAFTTGLQIANYTAAVDTFIGNGGVFICWLCGHYHWDQIATTVLHPKQLYIAISSGAIGEHMAHRARVIGQESEDLFNFVAVDTFRKHIRVARVGSKLDRYLQHAGTMCLSYDTTGSNVPHLLSSW